MKTAKRWTALLLALALGAGSLALNAQAGQINNAGTFTNSSSGRINNTGTLSNTGAFSNDGRIAHFYDGTVFGNVITGTQPVDGHAGTSGSVSYTISGSVLTVSGTGAMADYSDLRGTPWYSARGRVQTIVIESGVTYIGEWAFGGFYDLQEVWLPASVTGIGGYAFSWSDQTAFTYAGTTAQWGAVKLGYGALCWEGVVRCADGDVSIIDGTITAVNASTNRVTVDGVSYSDAELAQEVMSEHAINRSVQLYLVDGQVVNYGLGYYNYNYDLSENGTDGQNGFAITYGVDRAAPGWTLSAVPSGMENDEFFVAFYLRNGGWQAWYIGLYSSGTFSREPQYLEYGYTSVRIYKLDKTNHEPTGVYLASWPVDIRIQNSSNAFPNASEVTVKRAAVPDGYRYVISGLNTAYRYNAETPEGWEYSLNVEENGTATFYGGTYSSITLYAASGKTENDAYVVSWSQPKSFDVEDAPNYAVVLGWNDPYVTRDENGITKSILYAELLYLDGTSWSTTIDLDMSTQFASSASADGDTDLNSESSVINVGDIVTYTVDSEGLFTLTLSSDAKEYSSSAPITRNGTANLNGSTGLLYGLNNASTYVALANEKTIFALCDPASRSTRVYYGIAQAPDVTVGATPIRVSVVPSDGGDYAEFVFIQVADDTISPYTNACGDNLTWTLDGGVLTISGTGAMYNYDVFNAPWEGEKDAIETVVIESGITEIGRYAFSYCKNLTSVNLPDTLSRIGLGAFCNCTALGNVTLPEGLTWINGDAFLGCSSMTELHIPASVQAIAGYALARCDSLKTITVASGSRFFKAVDNVLFSYDGKELVSYAAARLGTSYVLPDGVLRTGQGAFSNSSLTSVAFPENFKDLGIGAFEGCENLNSVTLPDSLSELPMRAFERCSSLTDISIPSNVKSIGETAFMLCSNLTTVSIPESVLSIGGQAFYGCAALTTIHYAGSPSQWKDIQIAEDGNEALTTLTPICAKSD